MLNGLRSRPVCSPGCSWNAIVDPLPWMWRKRGIIQYPFLENLIGNTVKTNMTLRVKKWLKTDFILSKVETAESKTEVGERSHAECCCAVSLGWPALKASTSSRRNFAL